MARLAPAEARTEMFGLFALSGKITSFAGPLVLAWVTAITDNQRLGMSTIIVFLVVGLVLLRRLPDNR
jgi:UMF1 family MFS transporter